MSRRYSTPDVIAATFSTDWAGVKEARYHGGHTRRAVYAIGDDYFCVSKTQPRELGLKWERHSDQFFAVRAGTVLWVADMNSDAAGDA